MIAALLRALRDGPAAALPGAPDDDSPAFVSGLALGALVGAAIAGSTLWRRLHAAPVEARDDPESSIEPSVTE